jgi:hypothetical protein
MPDIRERIILILSIGIIAVDHNPARIGGPGKGKGFPAAGKEFFIAPVMKAAVFSISSLAFGGGLLLGYDEGAMGLKALCLADTGGLTTVEFCLFLRFYPVPRNNAGFFIVT